MPLRRKRKARSRGPQTGCVCIVFPGLQCSWATLSRTAALSLTGPWNESRATLAKKARACQISKGAAPNRVVPNRKENSDEDPFGFACSSRRVGGERGPCRPPRAGPARHRQVRAGLSRAVRLPDPRGTAGHRHRPLLPHRRAAAARPGQRETLRHDLQRSGYPADLGHRAHRASERRQPGHSRRQRRARRAERRAAEGSGRLRDARGRADAEPGRRRRLAGAASSGAARSARGA